MAINYGILTLEIKKRRERSLEKKVKELRGGVDWGRGGQRSGGEEERGVNKRSVEGKADLRLIIQLNSHAKDR